jgi:HEAT repeat protein
MEAAMAKADPETAERIITAYASLGKQVVPLAIKALNDGDAKRRERALMVLGRLGPEAAAAVPDLINQLKNDDPKVRTEVLFVLAAIGPKADAAAAPVTAALSDADREVVLTAGYCLGKIGPAAKSASSDLQKLVGSEDKMLALTGVWALLQIGPQDPALAKMAVPLLTEALRHERVFIRVEAAMALGKLGKAADSALPQLELTSTLDGSPAVRQAAADAMKQIKG